jgi:type I restriction enzyme, S subunit
MSELPRGWAFTQLADIVAPNAPIIYGILQPGPDVVNGVPYVRPTEIVDDIINVDGLRRTSREIAERYQRAMLQADDVILSIVGTIGKVATVPPQLNGSNITQSSCRLRPNPEVIARDTLAWFLRSPLALKQFSDLSLGTAVPRLNLEDVRKIEMPLPPPAEQRRIVAKIGRLSAKSGRARASLDHIPRLVGKYRQAILDAAFRGELANTIKPTLAETIIVGDVADIQSGSGFPKELQGKKAGDFPFAKVSDISRAVSSAGGLLSSAMNYVDRQELKLLRAKPVPEGSTVFAKIGEALRLNRRAITVSPTVLDNNCMALIPNRDRILPRYLYWFMQTVDLSPFAVATAVPSVRRGDVATLQFRLPSLLEQSQLVNQIETAFAWIDRLASEATSARKLIDNLDQAVLAKAFRGELVPQDPNDEPSSVLLERIRAERAKPAVDNPSGNTKRSKVGR